MADLSAPVSFADAFVGCSVRGIKMFFARGCPVERDMSLQPLFRDIAHDPVIVISHRLHPQPKLPQHPLLFISKGS